MIVEHDRLSIEKHVRPLLESHGYTVVRDGEGEWFAFEWAPRTSVIAQFVLLLFGRAKCHCVTICIGGELMTWNRRIAEILSKECRPFGKELKVHLNV